MAPTDAYAPDGVDIRSVLLVEDSSVTQDIIELVLKQAGHSISIAETGEAALRFLRDEVFDVVLMDFHLPDMTGLNVVQKYLAETPGGKHPTFVAITGDVRGLLADRSNCEIFDRVVPKPLDIDLVCSLVQASDTPVPTRSVPKPAKTTHALEELPFAFLHWPMDRGQNLLTGLKGIDAILVHAVEELDHLWQQPGAHLLPVIDLTGKLGSAADINAVALRLGDEDRIGDLIDRFHNLRSELHADVVDSIEPADRLLARLYVSGGALTPIRGGAHRSLIVWNLLADSDELERAIPKLTAEGFVTTTFFERVHHCPGCQSARLLIREECHGCGSAHLEEHSYLHHFRCAYQGPESDFRQADELICPKCRRTLAHFGRDYDRPGLMVRCHDCADVTSEPFVAFICVDCATRTPADSVPTRDVVSASVTDAGRAYLTSGQSFFGATRKSLRFAELPLELIIALNKAASRFNEARTPFVLGYIAYDNLGDIRNEHGARLATDARRLWLENLQQALSDRVLISQGATNDFFLISEIDKGAFEPGLESAQRRSDDAVRFNLGVRFTLFGPEDITG